jgi:nucleoside-diphosphate-sugar epimerase
MAAGTIAITGATGYLGTHLLRSLVDSGASVLCLARADSHAKLDPALEGRISTFASDADVPALAAELKRLGVTQVVHLATHFVAEHKPESIQPLIESNLALGTRVCEAASLAGVTRFLNVGSFWQHHGGKDYAPASLYAATKKAFEDILEYYAGARGMSAITLKLAGVYGPRDPRDKIINLLFRSAREQRPLSLSPGEQLVDLIYVDDAVRALCTALDLLEDAASGRHLRYSVSSGAAVRLKDLVSAVEACAGRPVPVEWGGRPYRDREFFTDWVFDPKLPGWSASIPLQEGLGRVYAE